MIVNKLNKILNKRENMDFTALLVIVAHNNTNVKTAKLVFWDPICNILYLK